MKNKKIFGFQKYIYFLFSLLLHLLILLIFAFIRFGDFIVILPEYSIISFSELPEETRNEKHLQKEIPVIKQDLPKEKKYHLEKAITDIDVKTKDTILTDTFSVTEDSSQTFFIEPDSSELLIKYAQSLLDTFLVRNPGYAKLILEQQAKVLAKKNFARETMVKKLNDVLHKYIQKNYPEGSSHAINQYSGPGIQIPIDKLIDLIKGIF